MVVDLGVRQVAALLAEHDQCLQPALARLDVRGRQFARRASACLPFLPFLCAASSARLPAIRRRDLAGRGLAGRCRPCAAAAPWAAVTCFPTGLPATFSGFAGSGALAGLQRLDRRLGLGRGLPDLGAGADLASAFRAVCGCRFRRAFGFAAGFFAAGLREVAADGPLRAGGAALPAGAFLAAFRTVRFFAAVLPLPAVVDLRAGFTAS